MSISTPGIGSGLDVNGIVNQLLALEKRPLQLLELKGNAIKSQISFVGQMQSRISGLQTAAQGLSLPSDWANRVATSSNADAVKVTANPGTPKNSYSVSVANLAQGEIAKTAKTGVDQPVGGGTLSITAAGGSPVPVSIAADSTLSQIAAAINATADVGVSAAVIRDGAGQEQLVVKALATGAAGFTIDVVDNDTVNDDDTGLSVLSYGPTGQMANVQPGLNAVVEIDGVSVSSASNVLEGIVPGLTLTLAQATAAPVTVSVGNDTAGMKTRIEGFVKAYNELNTLLRESVKYDEATKTAGPFQGDSVIVGIQRTLRNMVGTSTDGAALARFSEIGIDIEKDGKLKIDDSKLSNALNNFDAVSQFFSVNTGNPMTEGMARKINTYTQALTSFGGVIETRKESLDNAQTRNQREQDRINDRLVKVEDRLRKQYSALDARVGSLQALSTYVAQQVAQWSKSN
jgi:flagellar hook-associated protein 2